MVNGRGSKRVHDTDLRAAARARAHADEHVPAGDWEPPAIYANNPKRWSLERYEQVKDPVLREALRRQGQSIRMLTKAMTDAKLTRKALAEQAGVSTAGAGAVFRGEVWPQVAVMLRLCAVLGLQFGTGQGFLQPDRVDPVVASLRVRVSIAGLPLDLFAAEAGIAPDMLLRVLATAQDIEVEAAGRVADALDAHSRRTAPTTLDHAPRRKRS
jgi:transcriptional regulator with XRE-family HTH domain